MLSEKSGINFACWYSLLKWWFAKLPFGQTSHWTQAAFPQALLPALAAWWPDLPGGFLGCFPTSRLTR